MSVNNVVARCERIRMLNLPRLQAAIETDLFEALDRVIASAQYIRGSEVTPFEKSLSQYCDAIDVIGLNSCTDALYLSLLAYGVGEGDEVITVPNSFFATTEAIMRSRAVPVFSDIDPSTHLIDIHKMLTKITPQTKAILPVHLFGNTVDIGAIQDVLQRVNRTDIVVIEDCAHALGSTINGKRTPIGECGAFSFNPGKNCGGFSDGGAVVTRNSSVAEMIRLYRDHGRQTKNEHIVVGCNSRLSMINDAVLNTKIEYIEGWNMERATIAGRYDAAFSSVPEIQPVVCDDNVVSSYHQYVVKIPDRDALRNYLLAHNVETGIHYPLIIPQQPVMNKFSIQTEDYKIAHDINPKILSLPCYPYLALEEQEHIISCILTYYSRL